MYFLFGYVHEESFLCWLLFRLSHTRAFSHHPFVICLKSEGPTYIFCYKFNLGINDLPKDLGVNFPHQVQGNGRRNGFKGKRCKYALCNIEQWTKMFLRFQIISFSQFKEFCYFLMNSEVFIYVCNLVICASFFFLNLERLEKESIYSEVLIPLCLFW